MNIESYKINKMNISVNKKRAQFYKREKSNTNMNLKILEPTNSFKIQKKKFKKKFDKQK